MPREWAGGSGVRGRDRACTASVSGLQEPQARESSTAIYVSSVVRSPLLPVQHHPIVGDPALRDALADLQAHEADLGAAVLEIRVIGGGRERPEVVLCEMGQRVLRPRRLLGREGPAAGNQRVELAVLAD